MEVSKNRSLAQWRAYLIWCQSVYAIKGCWVVQYTIMYEVRMRVEAESMFMQPDPPKAR